MKEASFVKQLRDNAVFMGKQDYSELKPDDNQNTWEETWNSFRDMGHWRTTDGNHNEVIQDLIPTVIPKVLDRDMFILEEGKTGVYILPFPPPGGEKKKIILE